MSTLNEVLGKAIDTCNVKALGRIVDTLRHRGMTYSQIYVLVNRVRPDVDEAAWDALLYEAETED